MSFKSFLSAVGHDFENGLNLVLGDVVKIATAEAPVLAQLNPAAGALASQIASLSTQAYGIVIQTEQKFTALGKSTDNGVKKFAEAVSILTPAAAQILGLAGEQLSATTAALINGAVAVLNALPAGLTTTSNSPTVGTSAEAAVSSAPATV